MISSLLDINKGSPIDYKSGGSACSTPTKETLKYDRAYSHNGPPLVPTRMGGLFSGSGTLGSAHHHLIRQHHITSIIIIQRH